MQKGEKKKILIQGEHLDVTLGQVKYTCSLQEKKRTKSTTLLA